MPPAYITVKTHGWRTGPREVLEKLFDPDQADIVDPRTYLFRLYIHLETGDDRYLHVNTGMWIGSGMRRGAEGSNNSKRHLQTVQRLTIAQSSTMRIGLPDNYTPKDLCAGTRDLKHVRISPRSRLVCSIFRVSLCLAGNYVETVGLYPYCSCSSPWLYEVHS